MKHEKSSFTPCKLCYVQHKHKSLHGIFSWIKPYVLIHVIKHDMDPNSNVNRRKIGPICNFAKDCKTNSRLDDLFYATCMSILFSNTLPLLRDLDIGSSLSKSKPHRMQKAGQKLANIRTKCLFEIT